jgi:anti-anti-sigma regulatory factor
MTLRIDTTREGPRVVVRLIGRIRMENLEDLERHVASAGPSVVLDLDEVTLVNVDVVHFLSDAEGRGTELRNCPPFIREWIERERDPGGRAT